MKRLRSLDIFRGITIAGMILVNSQGNQDAYSWLLHSEWNGCTFADLVFPFFMVIVGMSSVLALTNLKILGMSQRELFYVIIKRSVYIFSVGLLLNMLPNHFDLSHIRISGVLQRIAIGYFFSAILFLTTTIRIQMGIIVALLGGYWFLIQEFSAMGSISISHNLVGYLDQLILTPQHLYTPMFDPEGLLSTLPAIGSVLLGNVIGVLLMSSHTKQQQVRWMITGGLILLTLGLLWSKVFPLNKSLWSSSYVLWTGGLSYLVFAVCFALVEIRHWSRWAKPFILLGQNAMLVYILHVLFLKIQAVILVPSASGRLINLRLYITNLLFGSFSEKNASFCYAAGYTLFWLFIVACISKWRLRHRML